MSACSGTPIMHCMLDRHKLRQDGILAWANCVATYILDGTKKLQAMHHEEEFILETPCSMPFL